MMARPRAEERVHSGLTLHALYPLGSKVPGLQHVPRPLRRITRRAITRTAVRAHMARCRDVEVLAVTGSRGKTTTKDLLAAMLAPAGTTSKTRKNDNGLYGVPATLLALRPEDRFAVVEIGIFDQPGEMSWMASMFEPSVAILTSIAEDHTVHYGSRRAVAAEKRALLERVGASGTVVVSSDDEMALAAADGLEATVITAGTSPRADFRLLAATPDWPLGVRLEIDSPQGRLKGSVGLFGTHLAPAVALALAAASAVGVDASEALGAIADFEPPDGRLSPAPAPLGATWLLDDFKSRLGSQSAALRALGEVEGARRIAVVGEIQEGELNEGWRNVAELAGGRAELVIAIGRGSGVVESALTGSRTEARSYERFEQGAAALADAMREGDVILLHGATQQHLRRLKILLEQGEVGCRVRRCRLHWLCEDCPHLHGTPPPSVIIGS